MAKNKPITSWEEVPAIFDIPLLMRLFGISRCTALKAIYAGELPASKIGNSWKIDKSDAIDWFKACRNK